MRLFEQALDTIIENGRDAAPQIDTAGLTKAYVAGSDSVNASTPSDNGWGTAQQWQSVEQMRGQAKAAKINSLSIDQKIELALKQAEQAEKIAYRSSASISALDVKLDRAFQNLAGMIRRVGGGKPAVEPDPPGSSIFDDNDNDDPESILSNRRP